jgi:AraC family transcriptional regulator
MILFIKNMVCARCERTVGRLLTAAGLRVKDLRLGEVDIEGEPAPEQWAAIRRALYEEGFELLGRPYQSPHRTDKNHRHQ